MRWLCFIACWFAATASATIVWIDTDVSIGSPFREVDDGFALVLALHSPEIKIAGLSTTYGNASLASTTRTARDIIQRFGAAASVRNENVFPGAASAHDLAQRSAASEALARALRKQKLTYIALGPLTNLATLIQLQPKLAAHIERIIFVGGLPEGDKLVMGPRRSFHIHDANVFKDSVAADVVLRSGIPIFLAPVATSSRLLLNAEDLDRLSASGAAGNYLSSRSKVWLWFWTHAVKETGGPIFDALAMLHVTRPALLSVRNRYAKLDTSGNLVVDRGLTNGSRRVTYCDGFAPETKSFVMQRLLRSSRGKNVSARDD